MRRTLLLLSVRRSGVASPKITTTLRSQWRRSRTPLAAAAARCSTSTAAPERPTSSLEAWRRHLLHTTTLPTNPYIRDHGWTLDAIVAAAAAAADEEESHSTTHRTSCSMATVGLVTVPDLVAYTVDAWNDRLKVDLSISTDGSTDASTNESRNNPTRRSVTVPKLLTDTIVHALQMRLSYAHDFVRANRWHEGMAVGCSAESIVLTQAQLATLVDIVLAAAVAASHDNATDDGHSTTSTPIVFSALERVSLGAVFVSAELYMLSDTSIHFGDTEAFLRQRVEEWDFLRRYSSSSIGSIQSYVVTPTSAQSTGDNNISSMPPGSSWNVPVLGAHSPWDVVWTAAVIGSSLASGVRSLLETTATVTPRTGNQ